VRRDLRSRPEGSGETELASEARGSGETVLAPEARGSGEMELVLKPKGVGCSSCSFLLFFVPLIWVSQFMVPNSSPRACGGARMLL